MLLSCDVFPFLELTKCKLPYSCKFWFFLPTHIYTESPLLEPSGATAYTCQPAVVEGVKAMEAALSDGMFPVIDKTVDVFAIPCVPGNAITFASHCIAQF